MLLPKSQILTTFVTYVSLLTCTYISVVYTARGMNTWVIIIIIIIIEKFFEVSSPVELYWAWESMECQNIKKMEKIQEWFKVWQQCIKTIKTSDCTCTILFSWLSIPEALENITFDRLKNVSTPHAKNLSTNVEKKNLSKLISVLR